MYKFMVIGGSGFPVLNEQMEIVGVVTEYDILCALKKGMSLDNIVAEKNNEKHLIIADVDTPAKN